MTPVQRLSQRLRWVGDHVPRLRVAQDQKEHLGLSAFLLVMVLLLFGVLQWMISARIEGVSRISAQTEVVEFAALGRERSTFPVEGMRVVAGQPELKDQCLHGSVSPEADTLVRYRRRGDGPLEIMVQAGRGGLVAGDRLAAYKSGGSDDELSLTERTQLRADAACSVPAADKPTAARPAQARLLPIAGKTVVGSEERRAGADAGNTDLLMTGKVSISARSFHIAHLPMADTLYPVSELNLPVGSRVESRRAGTAQAGDRYDENAATCQGYARVDESKAGLEVEIETDSPRLEITQAMTGRKSIVAVSGLSEIANDPNLTFLYKLAAVLLGFAGLCSWLLRGVSLRSRAQAQTLEEDL